MACASVSDMLRSGDQDEVDNSSLVGLGIGKANPGPDLGAQYSKAVMASP